MKLEQLLTSNISWKRKAAAYLLRKKINVFTHIRDRTFEIETKDLLIILTKKEDITKHPLLGNMHTAGWVIVVYSLPECATLKKRHRKTLEEVFLFIDHYLTDKGASNEY